MERIIDAAQVEKENAAREAALRRDYDALGEQLGRSGIAIDAIRDKAAAFGVAIPSWGVGTGGTRFARFPGEGEPRDIFDKLGDCAVIHRRDELQHLPGPAGPGALL
jgi:L-rhamnose isomerase / sugar isomerase